MDKRFVQAHKEARWALWLTLLYLAEQVCRAAGGTERDAAYSTRWPDNQP
jgi:uncharacterized membrane protein YhdT